MQIAVLAATDEGARLCAVLEAAGLSCQPFESAARLLEQPRSTDWDAIIVGLLGAEPPPDLQVRELRAHKPAVPIVLVAGTADQERVVAALAAGADDYLLRPVRRAELLLRMRVLLQRACPDHPELAALRFGPYSFEPRVWRASANGKAVTLTRKEFELALFFFRNLDRPLSRATILDVLWPHEPDTASRTLDTHVSRVRTKLGLGPQAAYRLTPVYSYGYRLETVDPHSGGCG
jgi:DNA-binding response OmpR family regulator